MRWHRVPESPVIAPGTQWKIEKRKEGYESDVTALVRAMLEDEKIREDQSVAWERWRNESPPKGV